FFDAGGRSLYDAVRALYLKPVNLAVQHLGSSVPVNQTKVMFFLCLRSDNKVTVNFINRDGEKITVKGSPGDSLLDVVINEDLDFDGFGACEGTLACSTCHLIFDEEMYKKLGPITDEEMDMLDLAYGLTDTSRLGCQICLTKSLEGMVAKVPESVADIRQTKDGSS
uniref:2Fe-2S ferredoxin-type domain-containing protein n=1 Tax=Oreochromis aureus TaxID=47969 RepID=A0AAZ1XY99_OREAU